MDTLDELERLLAEATFGGSQPHRSVNIDGFDLSALLAVARAADAVYGEDDVFTHPETEEERRAVEARDRALGDALARLRGAE